MTELEKAPAPANHSSGTASDHWGNGQRLGTDAEPAEKAASPSPRTPSTPLDIEEEAPDSSPTAADTPQQQWNFPRSNMFRVAATFWCFIVMGANDAAYGALIPYLEEYYHLNFVIVSLVFLSPFIGYTASALTNNYIHLWVGQRGVAFICPVAHIAAYAIIAAHPPYPVLVVAFMIAGFGNGLADAAWNAWIGNMAKANELLGFLHGFYGMGAVISPLVATSMITKAFLPWYSFYYVMVSLLFRHAYRARRN